MEYCCGGELFTLMKRQPTGRFTEEQIRFYTSEVLLVLEFVHLNGYIYRGFFFFFKYFSFIIKLNFNFLITIYRLLMKFKVK